MAMAFPKNLKSNFAIFLVFLYCIFSFVSAKKWKQNQIEWDIVSYYGYLPALYIYDDITLKFTSQNPDFFAGKYWPETAPNGGRVIKTTMGLSILYTPFFLLGHFVAPFMGEPQDGFSMPYQLFTMLGTFFYVLLGLYFLRKLLLLYFSDLVALFVIISVFFGTNLLCYTTHLPLMSHAYLFSISSVFIYAVIKWHEKPEKINSLIVGFLLGLLTLIRPTMILFILFFIFYTITDKTSFKNKLQLFFSNKFKVFLMIVAFIAAGLPQLIYWKYITGQWFYWSYTGERFYFDNPHIIEGLLGYRKGWLVYTPIMFFAVAGLFFMKKKCNSYQWAVVIPFVVLVYVLLSWWSWWYGGSFGNRAFIDLYGLLAVPMASFYDYCLSRKLKSGIIVLSLSLITLNLFQTWQYKKDLIHYDGMTRKAYWMGFFKTHHTSQWWNALQPPNYDRARKGLQEFFEEGDMIREVEKEFDFEDIESNFNKENYSSQYAEQGKYSFLINNKTCPYTSAIELTGKYLKEKRLLKIVANAAFFCPPGSTPAEANSLLLIISFENNSGSYNYMTMDMITKSFKEGQWNHVKFSADTWEAIPDSDKIKIYIWNKTDKNIFIDNLFTESFRAKI